MRSIADQHVWSGRGLATIPRGGKRDRPALSGGNARHEVGEAWDGWSRGRDRATAVLCMAMMCREQREEDL
jgi:hypothetical protein